MAILWEPDPKPNAAVKRINISFNKPILGHS